MSDNIIEDMFCCEHAVGCSKKKKSPVTENEYVNLSQFSSPDNRYIPPSETNDTSDEYDLNYETDTSFKMVKKTKKSKKHGKTKPVQNNEQTQDGYLGVLTRENAESALNPSRKFGIYHQLSYQPLSLNIQKDVNLAAIYRSSKGTLLHFPIRELYFADSHKEYYVDCGRSSPSRMFADVGDLLKYYLGKTCRSMK